MYGRVTSDWEIKNDRFNLTVEIPPNTRATVRLPKAVREQVTEGGKSFAEGRIRQDGNDVSLEIGSGRYVFAYSWNSGTN